MLCNRTKNFFLLKKKFQDYFFVYSLVNYPVLFLVQGGLQGTRQIFSLAGLFYFFNFLNSAYMVSGSKFSSASNICFLIRLAGIKQILNILVLFIFSIHYGWLFKYSILGYNFSFRNCYRRRLFKLNLGFSRHKLIINVPDFVYMVRKGGRRKFVLFCNMFSSMFYMLFYLHNLRNILPYKLRGMILAGSRLYVLKQGKKVKFR